MCTIKNLTKKRFFLIMNFSKWIWTKKLKWLLLHPPFRDVLKLEWQVYHSSSDIKAFLPLTLPGYLWISRWPPNILCTLQSKVFLHQIGHHRAQMVTCQKCWNNTVLIIQSRAINSPMHEKDFITHKLWGHSDKKSRILCKNSNF